MHLLANPILLFIFAQSIFADKTQKCGQYSLESLQNEIRYNSHKKGAAPLHIKIQSPTAGEKVFVGYFTAADGAIRCVAVKLVNRTEAASSLFKNSIRLMDKIYEKFEKEQRKHLVEIIDTGYTTPYMEEGIVIMELGDESLRQRLKSGRHPALGANDRDLMSAVEKLAQPLVEFHEIAIHMDVNPRNYLYVSENGNLLLKLIDFEGSQLLRNNLDKNECVPIGEHAFTPEYTGPEYYGEHGREISTKFDIWSVGIIVFEILLGHLRAEQGKGPMEEDEQKSMLFAIGNLFLGFTRNNLFRSPGEFKNMPIDYSKREWFEQNTNAMETVLQLWQKFPKTALLVTNMLNVDRKTRLTAKGILNYIKGSCQIGEFREVKSSKDLRIFNSVKFGEFLNKLRIIKLKNKAKCLIEKYRELNGTYKKIKIMVKKVIEEQQMEIRRKEKPGKTRRLRNELIGGKAKHPSKFI